MRHAISALLISASLPFLAMGRGAPRPSPIDSVRPLVWQVADEPEPSTHCTAWLLSGARPVWITNQHCADGPEPRTIEGRIAVLLRSDAEDDLAALGAPAGSAVGLHIARDDVRYGQAIHTAGFLFAIPAATLMYGRIMAPAELFPNGHTYTLADITSGMGMSGSPTLNDDDEVVGVNWGGFGGAIGPTSLMVTRLTLLRFTEGL